MFEFALIIWLICGIAAASVASGRGASGCLWFGLGVLFGPFGLAFAFIAGDGRECPSCRKNIHSAATLCPHCGGATPIRVSSEKHFDGGTSYRCSACKHVVALNIPQCPECGVMFNSGTEQQRANDTKKCPDCAEEVKADARKCRFCGFVFTNSASA